MVLTKITPTGVVLITVLLIVGLVTPVSSIGVQDGADYPEECEDAPVVENTGVVTGVIDSPHDTDAVKVEIAGKGDYVTVAPRFPDAESEFIVRHSAGTEFTLYNATDELWGPQRDGASTSNYVYHPNDVHVNTSWEVWPENAGEPTVVCLEIEEGNPEEASIPYEYAISLTRDSPEPVTIAEKINRLEKMLEEKNETIDRLQNNTTAEEG